MRYFSFDACNLTRIHRKKISTTYTATDRGDDGNLLIKEIDKGQDFLDYSRALKNYPADIYFIMAKQFYKAVYFSGYPSEDSKDKSVTLAFSTTVLTWSNQNLPL